MNLMKKIEQRIFPMKGIMTFGDYREALRVPEFQPSSTKIYGESVEFSNAEGFFHSLKEIFQEDVYQFKSDYDQPNIIDAGANIGLATIYFKKLYPNCNIIAYEPDPDIFRILSRNVAIRAYQNVELQEAAVWTENGYLDFYSEGSLAGSSEVDFLGNKNVKRVRSVRLKDAIAGRNIDFLKLDIEGAETSVLFDIESELNYVKNLFFEYHSVPGKPQALGDLLSLVKSAGFRYDMSTTVGSAHPFVERINSPFDLQMNVSCFRPR